MISTRPPREQDSQEAEAVAEPTWCQRISSWIKPPPAPTPLRFNTTSQRLLAELGSPRADVVDELLTEASAAYKEAGDRAESAERRATTIQGSIAIAASLTLAGGSLLVDATRVPSRGWEIAISGGFAVTVCVLAVAAWRAFLVTWPRFLWASPAVTDILEHAREPKVTKVKLRYTADLLVAYGRNDSIARLKLELLGQAVRWLMTALALLATVAIMIAVYATRS